MAKEYIEREALLELVEHLDKYERCKNCYHLSSCDVWVRHGTTLYDDYDYSVENCPYYIPTADVVEVRHGEWVEHGNWFGHIEYKCTSCNDTTFDASEMDYCPWCGAKMDGKEE